MGVHETQPATRDPPMNPALATPLFVLGGALIFLFFYRVSIRIRHHRRLRDIIRRNDQVRHSKTGPLEAGFKRYILYAPAFSIRHSREFRPFGRIHMGTMPLRLETALILGYVAINVIFILVLVDWWTEFTEKMNQLRYAAGHLAVMNTPGLVLTAGRNNPLIPLLGLPFDTFNFAHRWIGRIVATEAVIHMGCVVARMIYQYGFKEVTNIVWGHQFFICGLVALIGFVLIVFQAMAPMRHAFYELFLHLHISLAVMAFVGLWYHIQHFKQQNILLATVILWGLDRASRLTSLIWRNLGKHRTEASIGVLPGSVARVDVAVARPWAFKPGQYIYLYIPSMGLWTSHPFSIAWKSTDRVDPTEKRQSGDSANVLLGGSQRTTMSFLIKGRDGFTNKLLKKIETSPDDKLKVAAFVEGPFGGLHSLASYGTVLLVAGGIGITHPMSSLHDLVNGFSARAVATRKIRLIWVVRSWDHLTWVESWMGCILNHPVIQSGNQHGHGSYFQFPSLSLSIEIYITTQYGAEEYTTSRNWAQTRQANPQISINIGKPYFDWVLASESAQQIGAMAVSVCGPGGLSDDVRKAARDMQGEKMVDFYEESFSW